MGKTGLNFVDSYKFNIAAYTLSEMLGIDDMLTSRFSRTQMARACWLAELVAPGENGRRGSRGKENHATQSRRVE